MGFPPGMGPGNTSPAIPSAANRPSLLSASALSDWRTLLSSFGGGMRDTRSVPYKSGRFARYCTSCRVAWLVRPGRRCRQIPAEPLETRKAQMKLSSPK